MISKHILWVTLLLPLGLPAQQVAGVWTGYLSIKDTRLPYELVLSEDAGDWKGFSLTVFTIAGNEHTGIKTVKVKNKKDGFAIEDDKLIHDDYSMQSKKVRLYGKLSFDEGSATIMRGTFFTRSIDRSSFHGTIYLEKKDDLAKTKLTDQLEKLNLASDLSFRNKTTINPGNTASTKETIQPVPPANEETISPQQPKDRGELAALPTTKKPPSTISSRPAQVNPTRLTPVKVAADLALRKTEVLRHIDFASDSLVLNLYDNGEVDGDTVTVLVNNQVVIASRGLSTNAIRTTIYTPRGSVDSLQVTMYAENLGRIAPNTGLLVIEDGADQHRIRFEGDFKRNSAVIFRRRQ